MSRYKFRGKSVWTIEEMDELGIKHQDGWVYGNLITNGDKPYIVGDIADWDSDYIAHEWWMAVDPKTVGQYTGLKDKRGVEICEGDVINRTGIIGHVKFVDGSFLLDYSHVDDGDYLFSEIEEQEIIGNKFLHPHLLEDK